MKQEQAKTFCKQIDKLMERYYTEWQEVKKTKDSELIRSVHQKYGNKIRKKIADFDDFSTEQRLQSRKGIVGIKKVDEEVLEAHNSYTL